jgi:hypothetical protein
MLSDELERLQKLRDAGTLNEEEFQLAKQKLLQTPEAEPQGFAPYAAAL